MCTVWQCLLLAQCTLQPACTHCALCDKACYLHSAHCNLLVHIVHCVTMLVPTLVTCRSPQDQRPTAQATRVACCAPTACYVAYVCPAHWHLLCVSVCPALIATSWSPIFALHCHLVHRWVVPDQVVTSSGKSHPRYLCKHSCWQKVTCSNKQWAHNEMDRGGLLGTECGIIDNWQWENPFGRRVSWRNGEKTFGLGSAGLRLQAHAQVGVAPLLRNGKMDFVEFVCTQFGI